MYFNVIFKFNLILNFISLILILLSGYYLGDFKYKKIEKSELLVLIFIIYSCIYYFYFVFIYKFSIKRVIKKKVQIPEFRLYSLINILWNIFNLKNPLIAANSSYSATNYTFIYNLFDFKIMSIIYYIYYRKKEKNNFIFIITILSYITIEIINGWSGFILILFMIELYFIVDKYKNKINYSLLTFISILFAGVVYKLYNPLKMSLRGLSYVSSLSYLESLEKVIGRMANFSNVGFFIINKKEMIIYINQYMNTYRFLSYILQQVIPRGLYYKIFEIDKSIINLNIVLANYKFNFLENINRPSGFDVGILSSTLYYFQKIDSGIIFIIMFLILLFIYKISIDPILNISKYFSLLVLIDLNYIWVSGEISSLISKSYKYLFIVILFTILDFIKKVNLLTRDEK